MMIITLIVPIVMILMIIIEIMIIIVMMIIIQPSGWISHRTFEVAVGLSLRSRIQSASQRPEHFIVHCLARPLPQGPDIPFRETMPSLRQQSTSSEGKSPHESSELLKALAADGWFPACDVMCVLCTNV